MSDTSVCSKVDSTIEESTPKERKLDEYLYLGITRAICHKCYDEFLANRDPNEKLDMVDAEILVKSGKVYLKKYCPKHGNTLTLKSNSIEWYKKSWDTSLLRRGTPPLEFRTKREHGCPYDCGICSDHHQHICAPVIDITDACDMNCSICVVTNRQNPNHISLDDFKKRLDSVIQSEGSLQILILTGGEPTMHPNFFELVEEANSRKEITRVDVISNGLKIAKDEEFVKRLKENDVYINLQFDGFDNESSKAHRGVSNLLPKKMKAFELLNKHNVRIVIQTAVSKGVNEDQLGEIVKEFSKYENVTSLIFQPLIFAGEGGYNFGGDPLDRITGPDIVKLIAEQSDGLLEETDFDTIPCAHSECQIVAYLWVKGEKTMPLRRVISQKKYLNMIKNELGIRPDTRQSIISGSAPVSGSSGSCSCSPTSQIAHVDPLDKDQMSDFESRLKQIFIHHYMDAYNFDLGRLKKCCNMLLLKDGRQVPLCWYNIYERNHNQFCRN